ncbi:MAG: hypothetical protein IPP94_12410 [Ignavibacteria bacterium]|nr:hypothetical protein [Ignavibacteria bacterium]
MSGTRSIFQRAAIAFCLLSCTLTAQHRIEGRVVTLDSLAVRNALVLLRPLSDTVQYSRQLTDSLGRFSFDVTPVDAVPAAGQMRLDQNYPNPFAEHTTLTFAMPSSAAASLAVYDLIGRRVRALRDGPQPAGEVRTVWDGRDEIGQAVPPGVYVAVLRAAYGAHSRMLLRGEVGADGYDLQRSADAGRIWNAVMPKTWMRILCILHDRARPLINAFCSLTPQRGAVGWRTQVGCVDEAKNLIV